MSDFLPPVILHLAADISEYTEKLALAAAQLEAFTQGASEHLEGATRTIGAEGERAGREYGEALPRHVTEGADRVVREATGRLRDERGRFIREGEGHGAAVAEGFLAGAKAAFSNLGSMLSDVGNRIGSALKGASSIAGSALSFLSASAFPALIAAALQAVPALAEVAGALAGAIPAAAAVGAGALATLALGFHGLTKAIGAVFAPAAGGAVQSMNQIANAEWNLKQAQQQAIQTQEALNQARVAAAQNIKDLALAMSGAKLNVEEAQLAVKDADAAWRAAFATGNQDQIYRTNLALREAQQRLAEAQNSSDKTAAQKADADARGVEGSQQVQQALQAQANALHAVEQAQQALTQAQHAGGGAASALATAMAALAPSARAVVQEIQRLKPELHDIQQTVQQRMFAGLAGDLDNLAHAWLPGAKAGLAGLADQFNLLFRGVAQGLATPAFTGALTTVFKSFTAVLHDFASLAPAGVSAFGHLAAAASPFLESLGKGAASGLSRMLDGINKLATNGGLQKFFATASQAMSAFGGLLHDVASIIGSVFQAINSAGGPAMGVLGTVIHQLAEFFKSADGMKALSALFKTVGTVLGILGDAFGAILPVLGQVVTSLGDVLGPALATLAPPVMNLIKVIMPLVGTIADALLPIITALAPALADIVTAATPIVGMLGGAVGEAVKAVVPIIAELAKVLGQILAQALTALQPLFAKLLPVLIELVKAVVPAVIPVVKLVGQVFAALMPILTPLISLLADILAPVLKLLVPIIGLLAPVVQVFADALVAVITPIADFIGWLVAGLDKASTWKAIGKWFTDLWHTISGAFEAGAKWVGQKWDEFVGYVTGLPKRIWNALVGFDKLLLDKGKDLVRGLWDGIEGMGSWLWDKIMGWAKSVIPGPIAHALGISSPSKVAANLARWVPIGIAQGLDDGAHHVVAASGRLANAMVPDARSVTGLPVLDGSQALASHSEGSGSLPPLQITIPVQIGGRTMETVHLELIPYAQRYKRRTGASGLG